MSQILNPSVTGVPAVPTSFVADSGAAVPVANTLNILGSGDITTSAAGNTVTLSMASSLSGLGTTIGAVTVDLITFSLAATSASYSFDFLIAGIDVAGNLGTTYRFYAGAKTSGAAATVLGTKDEYMEDGALTTSDVLLVAVGNTVVLRALGVAGSTIKWVAKGIYSKAV